MTLTVSAVALLCGVTVPHAAADVPGTGERWVSQAAYLAEQLREDPVYVSDQVPRAVPRSAAPLFAQVAEDAGVPVYFMLLPSELISGSEEGLLASVHDRLGRDGLYVVLGDQGIYGSAVDYGVEVPAEDAMRAAQYELPYDAGALAVFERFVAVLTSGEAAQRADTAAEEYGAAGDPAQHYTSNTDRRNQGFVTGALLSGLPLAVLLCGFHVLRRRERRRAGMASAASASLSATASATASVKASATAKAPAGAPASSVGGAPPRRRGPRVVLAAVAALSAALIAVGSHLVFDETRSEPGPDPTAQDMRARVERVAEGLRKDPLYTDPESPDLFDAAEQRQLRERLAKTDVPVYIAAVPSITESASGGDERLLAEKLHGALGESGVYVIADTSSSAYVTVSNYGARIDDATLYDLPEGVEYPSDAAYDVDDQLLPERLGQLLAHVAQTPTGPPGEPYYDPEPAADPVAEDTLPPLTSGDFWPGLAFVGPVTAVLLLGLTAVTLAVAGGRVAGRQSAAGRGSGAGVGPGFGSSAGGPPAPDGTSEHAPSRPSTGWLRRTVRSELDALSAQFDAAADGRSQDVRDRVWDCLDAARLLIDEDGDRRVDADATAEDLACALTLVRIGAHALTGDSVRETRDWCAVNPLHGAATATARFRVAGFAKTDKVAVCDGCRRLETYGDDAAARVAERVMLRLPGPDGGSAVRYDELDGPVQLFGSDTDRLVADIREYLGVH